MKYLIDTPRVGVIAAVESPSRESRKISFARRDRGGALQKIGKSRKLVRAFSSECGFDYMKVSGG
jgi:hypothetical protein